MSSRCSAPRAATRGSTWERAREPESRCFASPRRARSPTARVPDAGRRQGRRRARARAPADRGAGGPLVRTDRGADRRGGAREDSRSGVTRRGRFVLALGLFVYLAAWAFGSKPLYPVATGLLLASAVAWGWLHVANRPFQVRRGSGDRSEEHTS